MSFRLKDRLKLIKISKESIKRSKKSIYFDFFDHYWSLLILIWSLSIEFELMDIFWTDNIQYCSNELKSGFKFGLKKLIKSRFHHNISWLVDLDRLDRWKLVENDYTKNKRCIFNKKQNCKVHKMFKKYFKGLNNIKSLNEG